MSAYFVETLCYSERSFLHLVQFNGYFQYVMIASVLISDSFLFCFSLSTLSVERLL